MNIEEYLDNKRICILGYGKQGKANYEYLRKHFPNLKIAIADNRDSIDIEPDDNVELLLGINYLNDLEKFDIIIKSPGVILKDVDASKIEPKIITDYELFLMFSKGTVVGITGTKGKSTTCTVMKNIIEYNGKRAFLLGNIGNPILDYIDEVEEGDYVVIEVSSHTLEFVKASPHIAILLNIYPEHLDHVNSLDDYIRAKFNIAKYQSSNDYFIYNADNELMNNYDYRFDGKAIPVSFDGNMQEGIYIQDEVIFYNGKQLMRTDIERKIKGNHTLNNMMFLLVASELLGFDINQTIKAICETEPLEHRMEYVGYYNNIYYYNDSIATIPQATINAIETIGNIDTLICGGMDRGVNQDPLVDFIKTSNISNIICMPETGNYIFDKLIGTEKNTLKANSLEEAVNLANTYTRKDKACLLSPAASSYNDFKNFEEKGRIYKKIVNNLHNI